MQDGEHGDNNMALTSCERLVLGKGAKVLIRESAQGTCPHNMEEEGEEQENEKEDEREDGQQRVEGRAVESIRTTTS